MPEPLPAPATARDALEGHRDALVERYGPGAGARLVFAPGRVNLLGAHLDYNGGPVLPTAIDRGTFVALRPRDDRRVRLASTLEEGELELDLGAAEPMPRGAWTDYPVGVLRRLAAGRDVGGLDVLFGGNLTIGAGLSSSASICVGTAFALDRAWGLGLSAADRVAAALDAERNFVGVRCGIMDPYAVGYSRPGHLLWVDCKDASVEHLPLDTGRVSIAVADTGVRRELARGEFNERVAQCARAFEALRGDVPGATCLRDVPLAAVEAAAGRLGPVLASRARHVAEEVERTFAGRAALERGDLEAFGAAITASHGSLRDLFEVSIDELDLLVDAATAVPGVHGARLTGAGFGGCVVVLLERGAEDALRASLTERYANAFGRPPKVEVYAGDPGPREV